ncbi:MAG TPA: hypothetical protein VJ822_17625 [Dongiaceae bacterium]|nr:hypothetical protein [Dongiaceae bacterium]
MEFVSVGKWGDVSALLSRALNVSVRGYGISDDSDLDQLLTELEIFLDRSKYANEALHAFWDVSYERGRNNQGTLVAHIKRLVEHEERNHILAGLKLITPRSQVNVLHLRSRFIQLSLSPDAVIRNEANRALRHIVRVSTEN